MGENGPNGPIAMLRGPTKITLDQKGRLSIPTKYRETLTALCDGKLICTVDRRRCLLIYPLPEWEVAEQKLMELPNLNATADELRGLLMGYATELDIDAHGRVLIPREHRDVAGLNRQVMLISQGNKFELWDDARWNGRVNQWLADGDAFPTDLPAELEKLTY